MIRPSFQTIALVIVLLVLVCTFGLLSHNFWQLSTLTSIANQIPALTLLSVGMTFVLVVGGIDLSVGSVLAFSAAVLGVLMVEHQWSFALAVPLCLLVGTFCGAINGMVSVWARIPSFIVTLGMLEIARGGTKWVLDSQTKYIGSRVNWIGEASILGLSPAFWTALFVVMIAHIILNRSVFGRYCVAIGSNEDAVAMSGIRAEPYRIFVFAMSGMLAALGGIAQTSLLSAADPNAATGVELHAIAACVIGGTSLMGGRGSVGRTFLGVVIISVLQTGLAHLGASDPLKQLTTGMVIILAVLVDALRARSAR